MVSVDTRLPRDPLRYDSFEQDGTQIYYSPRLARGSGVLELDFQRLFVRGKPILSGPEDLVARVLMGRI